MSTFSPCPAAAKSGTPPHPRAAFSHDEIRCLWHIHDLLGGMAALARDRQKAQGRLIQALAGDAQRQLGQLLAAKRPAVLSRGG